MIYSVNYIELTEKLNPFSVSRYLEDSGWVLFPRRRTDIRYYQIEKKDNFFQVVVPLNKDIHDYKTTMYKTIEDVAFVEEKSVEQLFLYLLNPNSDILKIRLDKKNIETGNIALDDAVKLYNNAKHLLAATAQDILRPQKQHYGRIDESIMSFLNNCKFGQTEIGSYVISVICPFTELADCNQCKQLSIFTDEEDCANSLTRKVTSRIMDNIGFIKSSIDSGSHKQLAKQNDIIISSNFYEALVGLNLESEQANLEFNAEWAHSVKGGRSSINRVLLTQDYCKPIKEIIHEMKEETNKAITIVGRVKELSSSPDLEKRVSGKIKIVYLDEFNKSKTATLSLEKSDYDKAIEAHSRGVYVQVIGTTSI
ncbi:MAG: hypothetical protein K2M82_00645, partial [Lachnospiraceae bacterium]|nr:hypothetical protein [Lachnospiraceae bacterium]